MFPTNEQKNMPRGQPKSGRPWKTTKTRFTTIKKSPGLKSTTEEKLKFRDELKKIKSLSRELIEQRKQIKENKKQRRRENLERQRENEKKSEILQVIKNSAKVKRMKKKQLRKIEKRDTLNIKT